MAKPYNYMYLISSSFASVYFTPAYSLYIGIQLSALFNSLQAYNNYTSNDVMIELEHVTFKFF